MNFNFFRCFFLPFLILLISMFHQKYTFSEESQNKNSIVSLDNDEKTMASLKTKLEACTKLKNRIVSYIDQIYYVKDCKLLLINNSEVVNKLIQSRKKTIVNLSSNVFSLIPFGEKYGLEDYYQEYERGTLPDLYDLCQKYERGIVTSDSFVYYFIDSCKKRPFAKYSDVLMFNGKSRPIYSLSPQVIRIFPLGNPIIVDKDNLFKQNEPEKKIRKNLPPAKILCAKLNRKVVTFHDSYFFIEDCHLFRIKDLNLDIQRKADSLGGIKELTVMQALGIPEGSEIKSDDVLKRIR